MFRTKAEKKILEDNKRLAKEVKDLENEIKDLEIAKKKFKDEIEDLKLRKKIDEEDIKHMIKMKEEKNDLEFQKKEINLRKELDSSLNKAHLEYRDKVEQGLEKQLQDMKEMYNKMMTLLPNVNVRLKGDV